jgi:hypothetical protein
MAGAGPAPRPPGAGAGVSLSLAARPRPRVALTEDEDNKPAREMITGLQGERNGGTRAGNAPAATRRPILLLLAPPDGKLAPTDPGPAAAPGAGRGRAIPAQANTFRADGVGRGGEGDRRFNPDR